MPHYLHAKCRIIYMPNAALLTCQMSNVALFTCLIPHYLHAKCRIIYMPNPALSTCQVPHYLHVECRMSHYLHAKCRMPHYLHAKCRMPHYLHAKCRMPHYLLFQVTRECKFYNTNTNLWSTQGCTTKIDNDGSIVCECSHMTSFAVILVSIVLSYSA